MLRKLAKIVNLVVTGEYLDLYVLATTALVFTVLGTLGISNLKILSSVVLALLALLALSQIRSRRYIAEIARSQHVDPLSLFQVHFPDDLMKWRSAASDLLVIGVSMTRIVEAGPGSEVRRMLLAGTTVRMLLLDPTNDALVYAAARRLGAGSSEERLRRRIQGSLDELMYLHDGALGRLQIRVASFVPSIGMNVIDVEGQNGIIVVQHYEHRPHSESAPILCLTAADGFWYYHFAAEAMRMWEDGSPWPLAPAR